MFRSTPSNENEQSRQHLPFPFIVVVVVAILVAGMSPQSARAALFQCRSDPIVHLSDNTLLRVAVDIGTTKDNVTEVSYTIHIPAGLGVKKVVHTGPWTDATEHVTVYADNPPDRYDSTTVVYTVGNQVPVRAHLRIRDAFSSVEGLSSESLSLSVIDSHTTNSGHHKL